MTARHRVTLGLCSVFLGAVFAFLMHPPASNAQTSSDASSGSSDTIKAEVDTLNQEVKNKRNRVKELDAIINTYQKKIAEQENQTASLQNQVILLDNELLKKQFDIERTKTELDAIQLEIEALDAQISDRGRRIERQKDEAAALLQHIHQADGISPLEVLLTQRSLSSFFDRLEEVKRLESDLTDALEKVKATKRDLESKKKERDDKRIALEQERKALKRQQLALEAERNFKASLADQTKSQESEFQRMLFELKQQQQSTSDDISTLESTLKDKLDSVDQALARGDVLLNWPVDPSRGITAKFHDPTYPFRNLFPHPGVDVRAPVGTNVDAAAGGYVAWNKKGRLYGNYTMVVHPGNVATVYAHLTKFLAKPDSYIERGDVIGKSGGRPGDPGAGLSTGPHLHFEVRLNGIPVDPENYLPSPTSDDDN